jgi:PAS domain S-box-containing protein
MKSDSRTTNHDTALQFDPWVPLSWRASADGSWTGGDSAWLEYTGLNADEAAGEGWLRAVHSVDVPRTMDRWQKAVLNGQRFETQHRLIARDGTTRWFLERAAPIIKGETRVAWTVSATDITDAKRESDRAMILQTEEALRAETQRILSSAGVAIVEFDASRRLSFMTREAQATLGTQALSLRGRPFEEVLPQLLSAACLEQLCDPPVPARGHVPMSATERELGALEAWVKFRPQAFRDGMTLYFRSAPQRPILEASQDQPALFAALS